MARSRHHIPLRTCVACRASFDKRELLRVVRTPEGGIVVDPTGKANGRGAYLCRRLECARTAARRSVLERHLGVPIPSEVHTAIEQAIGREAAKP